MPTIQLILSAVLGLFGTFCVLGNAMLIVRRFTKRESASLVPFMGGLALCSAIVLSPWPEARKWWWIGLLVDPGCALLFAMTLWGFVRNRVRSKA